jgi:Ala-tRNA(Pro) deacylase
MILKGGGVLPQALQEAWCRIGHPTEVQTDRVSAMRGHPLAQAGKCLIMIVMIGRKSTRFVLAVVRGDARVDTARIKALYGATALST